MSFEAFNEKVVQKILAHTTKCMSKELLLKYYFVIKVLDYMGLPILDDEIVSFTERLFTKNLCSLFWGS